MDQMGDFPGIDHSYHCGLVADVFNRERASRLRVPGDSSRVSAWMLYAGSEVAPFEAYMRWARDGSDVVLATIAAEDQRRGRMSVIMDALEAMAPKVIVESVGNPHLARFLIRRGYRMTIPPGSLVFEGYPGDYEKSGLACKANA